MFRRRSSERNRYSNRGNKLRNRRALGNIFYAIKNLAVKTSVVFLFVGIIYAILFTPVLAVKNVIIEGNKAITSSEIEEIIISLANRKILKIFNNNLLLINTVEMENAVISRFANIDTIKIEKKFPQTVKVVIKEKPADISWCNKIIIEKAADEKKVSADGTMASEISQCYLSDEEGVIYKKIGDGAAAESIKVFRDEPIEIGIKISDENLKNFIRKIFYDLNNKTGLSLAYLYALPPASRELHLVTRENWKIYFDLNRGAEEQIGVLSAFIKNELKENGNKSADYDYIDLRVVDRIYYKAKN